ncbi:MAG: hypothetical protein KAJ19_13365 [Gammaproteobacteria bacterium]|nr:hypothetical protein [Gammaproteobacteria bacterium]
MRLLTKISHKIGNLFMHVRTVGMIVLAAGFISALARNGCTRTELNQLLESTTGLNFENDVLHNHVVERDSILHIKEQIIENLEGAINRSEGRVSAMLGQYAVLYDKFVNIADSVANIPPDTSYIYLTTIVKPDTLPKQFPFSAEQVTAMHTLELERKSLATLNASLIGRIDQLNEQLALKDSALLTYSVMVKNLVDSHADLEQIIDNKDLIIEAQGEQLQKEKKTRRIWSIVGGAALAVLAAFAAGGG